MRAPIPSNRLVCWVARRVARRTCKTIRQTASVIRRAINQWFFITLAAAIGAYVIIVLSSTHRAYPRQILIAVYPNAAEPTILEIDEHLLQFGFPSAWENTVSSGQINVFLYGVSLDSCTNAGAALSVKTELTKEYRFTVGFLKHP
jgi:hypothetical protein